MPGVIAIVGRPNVGKSALFNRIARKRIAIVHDQPGVTRDRVTAEAEWHGRGFTLIDTGGIGLLRGERAEDVITAAMLDQVGIALDSACVILFVVNVQEGIVPLDLEVATRLRATRKPVLVVVNKVDTDRATPGVAEFSALGFDRLFPVTAIHGLGIEDLMDAAAAHLPATQAPVNQADPSDPAEPSDQPDRPDRPRRLAIVGRPNVGKSSLINALTGSNRVIVSPIPGTTRDAVDVPFEIETEGVRQPWVLVDTAGVRKARRIDDSIEYFSVERTKDAIGRCDIAVLVLDAEAGITEQDKKIADVIVEARRACIVVINKWDLVAESVRKAREEEVEARRDRVRHRDDRRRRMTTLAEFGEWVQSKLFFLDYAPVIFTSATEGFQLERLLEAVRYVGAQLQQSVPTAIVNRTLRDAIDRRQPVSDRGHRLTFYYATQVRQAPPTFLLFVNRDELFSPQYTKYLADELRRAFGFEGCPIVIAPKPRPKTIDPVRRPRRRPFSEERAVRHAKPRAGSDRTGRRPARPQAGKGTPAAPGRKGRPAPGIQKGRPAPQARKGRPARKGGKPGGRAR